MTNYPIGDFLIRIGNAAMAGKKEVSVASTKLIKETALALKKAGYLAEVEEKKGVLNVTLAIKSKKPIPIPEGVTVEISGTKVDVTGPKGTLSKKFSRLAVTEVKDGNVLVSTKGKTKAAMAVWGTVRPIISSMIDGVTKGWTKELELVGTGYRAEVQGNTLVLTVGYSHPINIEAPEGISFKVEKTFITVEGADKELVGQISANIRKVRPPEPYKGKGIKYKDEVIRRKAGKAAKTVGDP